MTIRDIRAKNVRFLRSKYGPKNKDFAEALGISESYASQISQDPPITNVGDNKAREIEKHLNLEPGWLDRGHGETANENQQLKSGQIDEVLAAKCVAAMMEAIEQENLKMPSPRIFGAALITLYTASQSNKRVIDPLPILRLAILAGTDGS
ncbi:helix-turn-helix domain-containing protein [Microbulbifer sp. 2201CG32-9]|uniref:helix-turn-helix domain-containing protein n=1 Tax=Microbulbifer sp. 2201CG32-9 TaxID=3232309 RepID=UPI00345B98F4